MLFLAYVVTLGTSLCLLDLISLSVKDTGQGDHPLDFDFQKRAHIPLVCMGKCAIEQATKIRG